MVIELRLRKVGNSVGVVLPKAVLSRLNVGVGDSICLTDGIGGSLRLGSSNPEFKKQMKIAEKIARRYRGALRELAK